MYDGITLYRYSLTFTVSAIIPLLADSLTFTVSAMTMVMTITMTMIRKITQHREKRMLKISPAEIILFR